jgi:hypothetical protein
LLTAGSTAHELKRENVPTTRYFPLAKAQPEMATENRQMSIPSREVGAAVRKRSNNHFQLECVALYQAVAESCRQQWDA